MQRKRLLLIGTFCIVMSSSSSIWVMNDAPMYDEQRTSELKQYLDNLVQEWHTQKRLSNVSEYNERTNQEISRLVRLGADPHVSDDTWGSQSLHFAAQNGDSDLAGFLIINGANINALNKSNNTPVFFAVEYGNYSVLLLLINAGADTYNFTNNFSDVLQFLRGDARIEIKNAILNRCTKSKTDELRQYLAKLYCACQERIPDSNNEKYRSGIIELISQGADPNAPSDLGFFDALYMAVNSKDREMVSYLLAHGARVTQLKNRLHPAIIAAELGLTDLFIELINAGTDLSKLSNNNSIAGTIYSSYFSHCNKLPQEPWLNALVRKQDLDNFEKIFINFAKNVVEMFYQSDSYGNTVMDIAIFRADKPAVLLLLDAGVDPLAGLFNGVFLAKHIPAWQIKGDDGLSFYDHVCKRTLEHCLMMVLALRTQTPEDVYRLIIKAVLCCKRHPGPLK